MDRTSDESAGSPIALPAPSQQASLPLPQGQAESLPKAPRSALVTGGGIGSAMAALAQALKEPYKTIVVILAPGVASGVTAIMPRVANAAARYGGQYMIRREKRSIIKELESFVKRQEKRLKKDTLSDEEKARIEHHITVARSAIIARDFDTIQEYILEANKPRPNGPNHSVDSEQS